MVAIISYSHYLLCQFEPSFSAMIFIMSTTKNYSFLHDLVKTYPFKTFSKTCSVDGTFLPVFTSFHSFQCRSLKILENVCTQSESVFASFTVEMKMLWIRFSNRFVCLVIIMIYVIRPQPEWSSCYGNKCKVVYDIYFCCRRSLHRIMPVMFVHQCSQEDQSLHSI